MSSPLVLRGMIFSNGVWNSRFPEKQYFSSLVDNFITISEYTKKKSLARQKSDISEHRSKG